jgi:hypothetical protein
MQTTIVTAYFQLKIAKASHDTYVKWMKNMLAIKNPMVIFCDAASKPLIESLRSDTENTIIIETTFKDFYTYRYAQAFSQHYALDTEKHVGHNMLLYMIWSEKSHFLKRAIELNHFNTDYFLWVDIGCFRVPNTQYIHWPNPEKVAKLDKSKVLMLSVTPFSAEELECNSLHNLPSFQTKNRIGGTMFGGCRDILLKWHAKYYEMLEHFIRINRFIGKDQSIMNSVYLLNRDLIQLVNWVPGCRYIWFYLQDYLAK